MKKQKKSRLSARLNPVAKHARQFNKAQVFQDKTQYHRHAKHRKLEPLPIISEDVIGKGSNFERASAI
ncbi:MAG: DUF7230 family protein [Gammaproteobacteria bacterium]